jgi:ubiquinone/menaquinone biosynthesis C-methylase UbiE
MNSNATISPAAGPGLYERMGERTTQPFALQILQALAPIKDQSLIDVAAGTGGLAVAAAEFGARVLATDMNAAMVERTKARLSPFELCRADTMDFHALSVESDSVDIAVSNFGVLAYSTWHQGLAEMIRVTRSKGRIALAMWTHRDDCSPAHVLRRVFNNLFPDRELWPGNLFPVFSEEELVASVQAAGCSEVGVHVATADWSPYSSADVVSECDPMFKSFPGYAALASDEVMTLRTSLNEAFQSYAGADGIIRLPTKAFVVTASKNEEDFQ